MPISLNETFLQTYRGKKVFLTGHTGFKGSWMLAWLHQLGANVKGYALAPQSDKDLYNWLQGDKLCSSVIADIRDADRVKKEILEFQPDFIFHLAAQPLVRYSYQQPLYTFEVNVNGTAHVLEALRELKNKCTAVFITTDKVYENREMDYAYKETDKLGGHDPYSASKAAAEIVIGSYRNSFFNDLDHEHAKAIASARAGNVIGGGDWSADRIIPDIVRALQQDVPVVVRNPLAVRPWQHVLEPVSGYLLLGARLANAPAEFNTAWNFGPHATDTLTVKEVVEKAIAAWGTGKFETPPLAGQPHEAHLLQLDIEHTRNGLGWEPRWSATEAIAHTIDWYKQANANVAAALVTSQITLYDKGR